MSRPPASEISVAAVSAIVAHREKLAGVCEKPLAEVGLPLFAIIDRYLIRSFLKIFLICWLSLTSLYLIVDVFSNLEEFLDLAKQSGGLSAILRDYYTPRIFEFFDRSAPLLALIAAIGSLVWMQRTNELSAIEAAGISKSRLLRPFIVCTAAILILSIVNRECWIPRYKTSLAKTAQNWDGSDSRSLYPQQDYESGLWIMNGRITLAQRRIDRPEFQLPPEAADFATKVTSETAWAIAADRWHPAGFVLRNVIEPKDFNARPPVSIEGRPLVIRGSDVGWIKDDEVFLASGISLEDLAYGQEIQRFASLREQMRQLRNPSVWFSNRQRVQVHARILRPVLDFVILLVGVPLMMSRRERNIFVAFGVCLLVVVAIQLLVIACQSLGASRIISPASLSAWMPLFILVPVATVAVYRLDL